ncbi:MAG: DNA-binding protein [Candidatus Sumerlaeia bacterium]|nr:DNA-binding protein [Candidatus Sumerlaeia bacterium]
MEAQDKEEAKLARRVRIAQLLQVYGALLTERQREFVRLHHDKDLSFGEIAAEFKISRQAVHDAVKQAEAAMENYEAGLGLLGKSLGASARTVSSQQPAVLESAIAQLRQVRKQLASQGVIYDTGNLVRAIDEVLRLLETQHV